MGCISAGRAGFPTCHCAVRGESGGLGKPPYTTICTTGGKLGARLATAQLVEFMDMIIF